MRASLASIVALAMSLELLACGPAQEPQPLPAPAAEQGIEELLPDLVAAIQAKQPVFLMDHVADEFDDGAGLDYFDVRSLVESYSFRDEEIGARLESVAIAPAENGARRVAARVAFAIGKRLAQGEALPSGATVYAFDLVFERRGPRWQAVRGSYRRE